MGFEILCDFWSVFRVFWKSGVDLGLDSTSVVSVEAKETDELTEKNLARGQDVLVKYLEKKQRDDARKVGL